MKKQRERDMTTDCKIIHLFFLLCWAYLAVPWDIGDFSYTTTWCMRRKLLLFSIFCLVSSNPKSPFLSSSLMGISEKKARIVAKSQKKGYWISLRRIRQLSSIVDPSSFFPGAKKQIWPLAIFSSHAEAIESEGPIALALQKSLRFFRPKT